MNIFEERYFNVNRMYLMLTGLWPYENRTKKIVRTIYISVLFVLAMPQLISVIVHFDNVDRMMLSVIGFGTVIIAVFKMTGMISAEDRMKKLYESIASNWLTIQDEREREILHRYSARGRLLTLFQATFTTMCISITLLPMIPKILDKTNPLTEPRPNMYVIEGEFFVDREAHFVELYLVDTLTIGMVAFVLVAADTMYIASSQHSCALYAIVSYRLLKLKRMVLDDSATTGDGDSYDWLVRTVQLHQKALTFTLTLNDSYSTAFLLVLPLNLLFIPFSSCAMLANLSNLLHIVPYASYFVAVVIHLFILCWPGQTILNHESDLCNDAYYNEWYAIPLRTRKLLLIFMLRCSQPASITAGGLFLLNFETYSLVLRTAVSYITVAASFR